NEKNQLLLGIRRANRPQTVMPSSVLSSDSMHIGLLAAAAHAAATNSRFTIFYNPRTSPSEFVIPLVKYIKAVYHTRVSVGMRFRMLFETEESSVRRYMGTITGISDLDPARWPNSHWRSVKVGWDESTAGERQPRVSLWEIEPLTTFPMYPSTFPMRLKRPWPSGLPSFHGLKDDDLSINSPMMWLQGGVGDLGVHSLNFQNFGVAPWIQPRFETSMPALQPDVYQTMAAAALQEMRTVESSKLASQSLLQFQQSQNLSTGPAALAIPSQCQQQAFSEPLGNPIAASGVSSVPSIMGSLPQDRGHLLNSNGSNPVSSSALLSKQAAFGPQLSSGAAPGVLPQVEQSGTTQSAVSDLATLLAPFSGREYSTYQGANDPQNNLLFGVNIDSSTFMLQHGIPNLRNIGTENDPLSMPFTASTFTSATGSDIPLTSDMTASSCVDESGFLQSSENVDQVNPSTRTFVKVHKSGSYGRSLDISKFSSYDELRSELARLFCLEGQLEDPQRSGWQLVFVDRENDVLLLGDDPWQEFVNNVWYIKILSPLEVQQMGKEGLTSAASVPSQKLSNSTCDGYMNRQDFRNSSNPDGYLNRQDFRNSSNGIASMGSLDYQGRCS
ncbi:hypothetical protein H0E87_004120, partial [Populus deltoides]